MSYLFGILLVVLLVWVGWIQPYRLWTNPRWYYIADAKKAYKKHRLEIWMPVHFCIAMVFCGILLILEEWWATGQVGFDDLAMRMTFYLLLVTVPVAIPCFWIARFIDKQFRIIMASPHCIECGYDLRGNPDATTCPECGAEVPQIVDAQQASADDPGQSPAGHDRA